MTSPANKSVFSEAGVAAGASASSTPAAATAPTGNAAASPSASTAARMTTPSNSSPAPANNGEEKPRLTEEEKKQNHIASEQKRRQAIREGFDRLTELVPGLEGQGRSEGLVLKRTVEFMREQLNERRALLDMIEKAGGEVDAQFKKTK